MIHINVYDPSEINIPCKTEEQLSQEIEEKCARQFLQEIPNAKEENKSKIPLK